MPPNLRAKGPCPEPQPRLFTVNYFFFVIIFVNIKLNFFYSLWHDSCEPPPKKKSRGFATTLALIGVGTAAVVAYAKYDCEFRNYIEEHAPFFNEFIKIATQEDYTYAESWEKFVKYILSW